MAHGERSDVQALREWVHAELGALNAKVAQLTEDLRFTQLRLDAAERIVARVWTDVLP